MKNPLRNTTKTLPRTFAIALLLTLTGCATTSDISPQYVSPNAYASYDCTTLAEEYNRIASYVSQTEKKSFSLASTGMNIGMSGNSHGIHPTISFGIGQRKDNDARDNELSKLYGERDAVIQTARQKSCSFANGLKVFGEVEAERKAKTVTVTE